MNHDLNVETDLHEMKLIRDEIFAIVPGIEKAVPAPVLNSKSLTEKEFQEEWVARNNPCLVKGIIKHWPAVKKWREKDYWMSTCGNPQVEIFPHLNHASRDFIKAEKMTFHNAIDRLFQNKDHVFSMPSTEITESNGFAGLLKDMAGFSCLPDSPRPRVYNRTRFFMYRRASTAWHYHGVDETLMCQVNGAKSVALFPPDIPRAKYVTEFLDKELHLKGQKLDKSIELRPMITRVDEGDALYIPPYWHHAVVPTDGEIGFTLAFCWKSPIYKLGDLSNFFVREVFRMGLWPLNKRTPMVPILASYAGASLLLRKITGQDRK